MDSVVVNQQISTLRRDFFRALNTHAPAVVERLKRVQWDGPAPTLADGRTPWLRAAGWAKKNYLFDPWIVDALLLTVKRWNAHPLLRQTTDWAPIPTADWPQPQAPIKWEPVLETEAEFRSRVETHITLTKNPVARPKMPAGVAAVVLRRDTARDLGWLVQFQVNRVPFRTIADQATGQTQAATVDPDTVAKAVKTIAELIGVTLTIPRGRRVKSQSITTAARTITK